MTKAIMAQDRQVMMMTTLEDDIAIPVFVPWCSSSLFTQLRVIRAALHLLLDQGTGDQSLNLVFGHEPFLIKTFPISKCPTDSRKLNWKFVQSFQAWI